MNTVNIDDVLKSDPNAKHSFRGVFSLDEFVAYLTRSNINKGIFVFNTQTSTKSGEHWICVIVEDKVIYYFDSFGRNPASYSYVAETLLHCEKNCTQMWKKRQNLLPRSGIVFSPTH